MEGNWERTKSEPMPGPSRLTERVLGCLIPPSCREHVLGDLHERYRSQRQYLIDAVRTAPVVILSQIRRISDPWVLLLEALALFLPYMAATWALWSSIPWEPKDFILYEGGAISLAIPPAVTLITLTMCDAWRSPGKSLKFQAVQDVVFSTGVAFLTQGFLSYLGWRLRVPLRVMLLGAMMAVPLVSVARSLRPSRNDRPRAVR